MGIKYQITPVAYNTAYRPIGVHPSDGRIFATRYDGTAGLYVVDRNLNLVSTLNTTIPANINSCLFLSTRTMILYATYVGAQTIYRSNNLTYTAFTAVFTQRNNCMFIERSIDVTPGDIIMCADYSSNRPVEGGSTRTDPVDQKVYMATNDGQIWTEAYSIPRNPQFVGDTSAIRHIHACQYDPYEDVFWIATGDGYGSENPPGSGNYVPSDLYGYECKILRISTDGATVMPVGSGSQLWRTTGFAFTPSHVTWGADTPDGTGRFRRLSRATGQAEELQRNADCIRLNDSFKTQWGNILIANQSREFSPDNDENWMRLMVCHDGEGKDWYEGARWHGHPTALPGSGGVTVFYTLFSDGVSRLFGSAINYQDAGGTLYDYSSTIVMDISQVAVTDYHDVLTKYNAGQQVGAGLMGNSVGMGYYAITDANLIAANPDNPAIPSYANKFRTLLQGKNVACNLVNKSQSGWTTQDHINNDTVAQLAALNPKPDIVFIPLQINDCGGAARIDWNSWRNNIRSLAQSCLDNGMVPVLVMENDINPTVDDVRTDGKTYFNFVDYVSIIAGEKGCTYLDTYDAVAYNATNIYDNVHPTATGHDLIYQQYTAFLQVTTTPVQPPTPAPTPPLLITDVSTVGVHAIGGFEVAQWDANPAGYQYPSIDTDPTQIVLFDEDMNPVALLEDAQGIFIEEEVNGIENLEFTLPIDSPNWPEIKGERYLHYQGREWVISTIGDKHDPSGTLLSNVQCTSNAIHELSGMRYNGQDFTDLTALAGMLLLFDGTGWEIGQVDSTELRSLQANRKTVLADARDWATQHTSYLVFDTLNHVVNLVKTPGKDNGVQIRIGKNLQGVDRFTDFSNMVTRLWPYGKDNLGIETVNSGISYIDNFSWYLSQGVTQAEIDADIATKGKASRYLKEGEWTASQYTDPQALYDDAVQQLANNCTPVVSYNFNVIDLSTLPGYEQEKYLLGDTVLALDEQLDISTAQYIVRRKWYPKQPYLDEMTLANKRATILDTGAQTARTLQVVDQRIDSWTNSADALQANFDAWQRAHNLNADGTIPIDLLRGIWYAAQSAIRAGKNESVIIDDTGLTIAEHSIIEDHGEAGALGQFGFGGQFVGENPMPVVIHWKTDRYLKATGGAIAMCAGDGLPIRTAVTPDGILAPSVIITDDQKLASGDGYTFMGTGGVQVVDDQGVVRAFLGHYQVADPANGIPDDWGVQIEHGSINWVNVNAPTADQVGARPYDWVPGVTDVTGLSDMLTYIDGQGIYTGILTAQQINGGTLTLGGANNISGLFVINDATGVEVVHGDNAGMAITNGALKVKNSNNQVVIDGNKILFQIVATGYVTLVAPSGQGTTTYTITHNLGYNPAYHAHAVDATPDHRIHTMPYIVAAYQAGTYYGLDVVADVYATTTDLVFVISRSDAHVNSGDLTIYFSYSLYAQAVQ